MCKMSFRLRIPANQPKFHGNYAIQLKHSPFEVTFCCLPSKYDCFALLVIHSVSIMHMWLIQSGLCSVFGAVFLLTSSWFALRFFGACAAFALNGIVDECGSETASALIHYLLGFMFSWYCANIVIFLAIQIRMLWIYWSRSTSTEAPVWFVTAKCVWHICCSLRVFSLVFVLIQMCHFMLNWNRYTWSMQIEQWLNDKNRSPNRSTLRNIQFRESHKTDRFIDHRFWAQICSANEPGKKLCCAYQWRNECGQWNITVTNSGKLHAKIASARVAFSWIAFIYACVCVCRVFYVIL